MSLLAVRGLRKAFGGIAAVAGIDFDVAAGEVVAMIGPNGAGKTTCFNMLGGQIRPDRGSILFRGGEISGLPAPRVWRLGIGRTFQVATAFASMTVRENVQMTLISHHQHLCAAIPVAIRLYAGDADALLDQVGMADQAERAAGVLAYGDVKRLELAVALAHRPRLLLLDEPTAGVAGADRRRLMDLIARIVRERGISVLFTEHDMDVVFGHADRVLVLHRGEMVAAGRPADVRADDRVKDVYLGRGGAYREDGRC